MYADAAAQIAWQMLVDAPAKPGGLTVQRVLLEELLPQDADEADLPLVAVYLAEDIPTQSMDGLSNRVATLQVEIRTLIADGQTRLSATRPFRAWALRTLLPNQELDSGIDQAEFVAFKPFGVPGNHRLAGALLELTVPFFFDPEDPE